MLRIRAEQFRRADGMAIKAATGYNDRLSFSD
jgi:hypothetical protein